MNQGHDQFHSIPLLDDETPNANAQQHSNHSIPTTTTPETSNRLSDLISIFIRRIRHNTTRQESVESHNTPDLEGGAPQLAAPGIQPAAGVAQPAAVPAAGATNVVDAVPQQPHPLNQYPELVLWLQQTYPFCILLIFVFIYKHMIGIGVFAYLLAVARGLNLTFTEQVAAKEDRSTNALIKIVFISLTHAGCIILFCILGNDVTIQDPFDRLLLIPPPTPLGLWDALFIICLSDFIVRFVTMSLKCLCNCMLWGRVNWRRLGMYYSLIEVCSNFYRTALPTSVWYSYFMSVLSEDLIISSLGTGFYLILKLLLLVTSLQHVSNVVTQIASNEVIYGRYASAESLRGHEEEDCSICQEKMVAPIVLECSHIFCEDCVTTWLDRERTCPLCRAIITAAGNRQNTDGCTSPFIPIF